MHTKHLMLAVVYDRFLFHASIASNLATDKPAGSHAARRPISCHQCQHFLFILDEWICDTTILKVTQFRPIRICALSNCRLLRFLQTVFSLFLKFIRPLFRVLCAPLLKFLIAFRYLFVLRLNFPGNKLHRFLTG